ncbi:hypothetical protein B0H34DRAFT_854142 [Crassisporium funariophilum]|nr:hypothetical protein B0H34DRAFT_854142 [Crassisporium funariophilum]
MAKVYDVGGYLRSVGVNTPVSTVHTWVQLGKGVPPRNAKENGIAFVNIQIIAVTVIVVAVRKVPLVLETRSDILNLCLTSNYVFANVSSVHYKTVVLQSIEQCSLALGMLYRRSDIARHVRQLVIRPQGKFRLLVRSMNGAAASAAVRKLAGAMCLDALVRFTWGEPV